jgi:hypothetical protein
MKMMVITKGTSIVKRVMIIIQEAIIKQIMQNKENIFKSKIQQTDL